MTCCTADMWNFSVKPPNMDPALQETPYRLSGKGAAVHGQSHSLRQGRFHQRR